jgi:PAS domain S-box-containing protein
MKNEPPTAFSSIRQQIVDAKSMLTNLGESMAGGFEIFEDIIASLDKAENREQHKKSIRMAIRTIKQLIAAEDHLALLIDKICSALAQSQGYSVAQISLFEGVYRQRMLFGVSSNDDRCAALNTMITSNRYPDCITRALTTDETIIVRKPGEQCPACPIAEDYPDTACLTRRLRYEDEPFGIIRVACPEKYSDDEELLQLFAEISHDIGFAVHKIEIDDTLRQRSYDWHHAQLLTKIGTWRFDLKTGQVDAPEQTRRIYGLPTNGALTIQQVQTIPLRGYRKMLDDKFSKLVIHGAPYNVEFMIRRPSDGAIRAIHSVARYDEERHIIIGSLQDITERKTAEQTIRNKQERLQVLIEGSRVGTWEWDITTGVTTFNEIWVEQLGYTLDELTPHDITTWERLVHPEDRERVEKALQDCLEGRTADYDCEHRLRHKNGDWIWILDRGRVVSRDKDGRPLLMFGTHTDVTRLKSVEQQARTSAIQLHEAVRAANVGLWDWNLATNTVFYSREWKQQIGYREDEIGDRFEEWETRVHPDDIEPTMRDVRAAIESGNRKYKIEFRFRHKDGSYRWILAQSSIVLDTDGTPVRVIGSHIDITEQKQAEQELRLRAELHRALLQTTADGYWLVDHAGRIADVNAAYCTLTGYTRDELLTMTIGDIEAVETPAETAARMKRIIRNGSEIFETWHRHKDGTPIPVEISVTRIDTGQHYIVCFCRDLTERKRSEEQLQAAHARLKALWSVSSLDNADLKTISDHILESVTRMTNSPYGFYGFLNGDESAMAIHSWSGLAMRHCDTVDKPTHYSIGEAGLWAEAVRQRRPLIVDDYRKAHPAKRGVPEGHVTLSRLLVVPFIHKDTIKSIAVVGNRTTPYGEDDIAHIQSFLDSVQAIIDSKQAEQELRRHQELLANLAKLVPGTIYQYRLYPSGHSEFPYASPGMNEIYEVTPDEIRLDASVAFTRLHPEDRDRVSEAIFDSARTQQRFHCEFRVLLPRQGLRWRWSEAQPQLLDDGSTLWYGIILDITEKKEAEEAQEQLQQQLSQAQKMESIGRLAGGVAHDFNNMLSVMLGYSEMGMDLVDEDTPIHMALSGIYQAAQRSADLTRQLLAFARKQTIEPKIIDLNTAIKNMLAMLRRLIGEDIELTWLPCEQVGLVNMDPSQIDQVLANLCVNARDAISGNGSITITTSQIVIDERRHGKFGEITPGDYVLLSITDTGCGMDTETMGRLFEPFFTTKSAGEGTGLGLATVFGIVKQNKGFIEVESAPGHGTTFTIGLPKHLFEIQSDGAKKPRQAAVSGSGTILLVEDEAAILQMAAAMLERLGYRVIPTTKPGEALDIVSSSGEKIDLLITDVIMPEMNGRDLVARCQAIRPELKCLYMSGYTADVIASHGVLPTDVHFLQKPFTRKTLSNKMHAILTGP